MLGEGFLFSCERLKRSLWETIVSSKAAPEVLKIKYKSEFKHGFTNPEAVAWMCSVIKMFLNILQNSQENTCISLFFNKVAGRRPQACKFIKKETLAEMFSCQFCEISKNTFFL